jgi:hypothetical protein
MMSVMFYWLIYNWLIIFFVMMVGGRGNDLILRNIGIIFRLLMVGMVFMRSIITVRLFMMRLFRMVLATIIVRIQWSIIDDFILI